MCPHGPYYYAYWKVERKLKKKYIVKQFDEYFGLMVEIIVSNQKLAKI